MRIKNILTTMVIAGALFMFGCSEDKATTENTDAQPQTAAVEPVNLKNTNFVLVSVNDAPYSEDWETPTLSFNDDLMVAGRFCNRFFGKVELTKENTLKADNLGMTKMFCDNQVINDLEGRFPLVLQKGAQVTLVDGLLTIKGDNESFVYKEISAEPEAEGAPEDAPEDAPQEAE